MTPDQLAAIKQELQTQDNRATANPFYIVQQRRRLYGFDTQWSDDNVVWLDYDHNEVTDPEELLKLEANYDYCISEPEGYTRTGYIDTWEFVQGFLTNKAAQAYIDQNKHRLTDPRIYVDSLYRNYEMIAVRNMLLLGSE